MASNKAIEWKLEDGKPFQHSLSPVLDFIGFQVTYVSPSCIQGRFIVNEKSAQAHGVLHGGTTAFIAESVGSFGAFLAAGNQRVAGVELSTSHLQAAPIGLEVQVKATPAHIGRRLQVWEIRFFSAENSSDDMNSKGVSKSQTPRSSLIALSKLTATVLHSNSDVTPNNMNGLSSKL